MCILSCCILTWPAAFAVLLSLAPAAPGQDARPKPELRLEVQPSDIIVDPATAPMGRLSVLLHNPGSANVTGKLSFIAPPGLVAKEVEAPSLPSAGDLAWMVDVTATEGLPSPAKLVIEFAYTLDTGSAPTISAAVATITVPQPQTLAANIKANLAPSEGNVDELRAFELRLQIDNPTRRPVEIGSIATLAPSATYIDLKAGQYASMIAPGGSISVPLTVSAKAAIPGTYTLLVGFNIRSLNPTSEWEPMTAQGKVTLGIPGITDALQFLGIPSFLLLPGALFILTFLTVLPWFTGLPQIDWKKPALLLLAVILSFLAAYVYPWATGHWLGLARDYLRGYELRDVIYVWAGSMAIGVAAAAIWAAGYWVCVSIRWLYAKKNEPQIGDQPLDILKKLRRHGAAFKLPARRLPNNAAAGWKLALPFGQNAGQQWLVQQGLIRPTDRPAAAVRGPAIQQRLEAIDNAVPGAIDALITEIKTGLSEEALTLHWHPNQDLGPRRVNADDYADAGGPHMIVYYEP